MKKVDPPDSHTWDFSDCPPDEITACLYYECSRESPEAERYFLGRKRDAFTAACLGVEYAAQAFVEFPSTPWLRLKTAKKQEFLARLAQPKSYGAPDNELMIRDDFLPEFVERLRLQNDEFAYGKATDRAALIELNDRPGAWVAVELDWSKSNNELKANFERLLKLRPAKFRKKPPGRKNHRDLLNGLGGKRLRAFCSTNKLPDPPNKAIEIWNAYLKEKCPGTKERCPFGDSRALRASVGRINRFLESAVWFGGRGG